MDEYRLENSQLLPHRGIVTFYVSSERKWIFLLASFASLVASIMTMFKIKTLLSQGVLVGEPKWVLLTIACVFSVLFILLSRKLWLSFSAIRIEANEVDLYICGGWLSRNIIWNEVDFINVGREILDKSIVDALVFNLYDGSKFKLLDQYTKSPRDLFVILRTFCNQHGIHVTFNSGGKGL